MHQKFPATDCFPAPVDGRPDWLVVAGEHSGDEHAARLIEDLRAQRPGLKVACLGGARLQAAGAQLLYDLTQVSVVGFVEVLVHYDFFKTLLQHVLDWIEQYQPRHICLVDYPGFNLRLAQELHDRGLSRKGGGDIGLSGYIGPQIWAWKAKRRFRMEHILDRLGVIFPFEVDCYKDTNLPVAFLGHPFVRKDYQLPFIYDADAPVLLLPGSRVAAVRRIFPMLLEGFRQVRSHLAEGEQTGPKWTAQVIYPDMLVKSVLDAVMERFPDLQDSVKCIPASAAQLPARAVLMSSGTMSLSVALSGIPGAIAYRLNPLSYWLARLVVKTPFIGISNLLLKRSLHPEYIQNAATPQRLSSELLRASQPKAADEAARGAEEIRKQLNPSIQMPAVEWLENG